MNAQAAGTPRNIVIGATIGSLAVCVTALLIIPSALRSIGSSGFLPHTTCYLNNQQLIALHLGSDAAIWLAYLAISCTLVYLVWRTRREIPFSWMFLAFGLFIVACGFTHFMEMVVLWKPLYWLSGDVKLVTAVASVVTAVALPGLVPQIHGMVASAQLSEERRGKLEKANEELTQISSHVMVAQDAERRRIARELHDGVGQYLAAIKISCDVAHEGAQGDAKTALDDALKLLERCTAEVRTMSHLLHPPLLEEMGLASAIPWYVEGFTERSGIQVGLDLPENLERLPQPVELAMFRVLQEGLTNIHRHSGSKTATIRLRRDAAKVSLAIEDYGVGFGSDNNRPLRSGVGIASMRERVRELGGELRVRSGNSGTQLEAEFPLPKEEQWQSGSLS